MQNKPTLQERVVASVIEAERLQAEVDAVFDTIKQPEIHQNPEKLLKLVTDSVETRQKWDEALRQAIHLCRLALATLPLDERNNLIGLVESLNEEGDLWEHYAIAEWYDYWPSE